VPQKVDKPQRKCIRTRNRDQEGCQPPRKSDTARKSSGRATLDLLPYRNGQEDPASVLWLLPFFPFLFRHVVCAVGCLDRAQGLGSRFGPLLQTHVACITCSEPRARSSRGHRRLRRMLRISTQFSLACTQPSILLYSIDDTYQLQEWRWSGRPRRSSVLSSGEAFGGVSFTFWLGASPLLDHSGSSPSVDHLFPVRSPTRL
jgi:hypothetical protein